MVKPVVAEVRYLYLLLMQELLLDGTSVKVAPGTPTEIIHWYTKSVKLNPTIEVQLMLLAKVTAAKLLICS
jgi:hypothetical protein